MSLDAHHAINGAGLRVIRAIGETGSYAGAAARLGLTQAVISQMVHRLEDRIGTPLVERRGHLVRLTEAGHVLSRHAVGVLAALAAAEQEVAAIAGLHAGHAGHDGPLGFGMSGPPGTRRGSSRVPGGGSHLHRGGSVGVARRTARG